MVRYPILPAHSVARDGSGLWRYWRWLPLVAPDDAVSLGEGGTALVRLQRWSARLGLSSVFAKLEFIGPTGSFKDRGAAVLVSHARVSGAVHLVEDSSGNAGASIAAYAARAGLACTIVAPASAPPTKLQQIRAYGARLVAVEGSRKEVGEAAMRAGAQPGAWYAGHNSSPYFVEGTKTIAFELIEAFGMRAPDHLVIPVGGGSLLWGAALGFAQWHDAGLCPSGPRLHAVQATGCMPLAAAFEIGAEAPVPVECDNTVAGGITIERPPRGELILRCVRVSGGAVVAVPDNEILRAQREIASLEGIFMEPTSAAAFAGLARLAERGTIRPDESVVVAVTGAGLKDPESPELWDAQS